MRAKDLRSRLRDVMDEPLLVTSLVGRAVEPYRRMRFGQFGRRSIVYRPTWLYGTRWMAVGEGVLVMPGAWLAVERVAWGASAPVLRIGDRVGIRANCTLSAAASIVIEDDVVLGGSVTVVDSDHTWRDGHPNVLYNPVDAEPVRIGRGTWVGDHATILRGSQIGELCVIGANSVVRGTVPDRSVAVGIPAKVVGTNDVPL
ncbi:MAG: acyltransferase [Actinomycetota bacterium]|nr:acyltransferase [Actinomycetota bacterium]